MLVSAQTNRKIIWIVSAMGLLMLLVGLPLFLLLSGSGDMSIPDGLKYSRKEIPRKENGLYQLGEVWEEVKLPNENRAKTMNDLSNGSFDVPEVEAFLSANDEVFEKLLEALPTEVIQVPLPRKIGEKYPSYMVEWHWIAGWIQAKTRQRMEQGDLERATDFALQGLDWSHRLMQSDGATIHLLTGHQLKRQMLQVIRGILHVRELPREIPARIVEGLRDKGPDLEAYRSAVKLDLSLAKKTLVELHEGKSPLGKLPPLTRKFGLSPKSTLDWFQTAVRWTLANLELSYDQVDASELPDPINKLGWKSALSGNIMGPFLYDIVAINFESLLSRRCSEQFWVDATRTAAALRRWHLDHGRLPESLAQLVPDYLPAIPRDLFDGQPLRYHRDKAILYSVGVGLKDPFEETSSEPKERPGLVVEVGFP